MPGAMVCSKETVSYVDPIPGDLTLLVSSGFWVIYMAIMPISQMWA